MPNIKDYFDKTTYKCRYFLGDRVKFKHGKRSYTGTVALDHLVSPDVGPVVHIFPDDLEVDGKKPTVYTTRHAVVSLLK
jgi:hypothetical protein